MNGVFHFRGLLGDLSMLLRSTTSHFDPLYLLVHKLLP